MIEQARSRALGTPTPVALILAARIEPDAAAARAFADQAVDVAPKEPWAFYARAFLAARAGDWTDAGADLDRTLELDPGHRPGRRLQARILARTGKPDQAIEALRVWIKASQDDARISAEERLDARLDLVQLHAELGNDQQALDALMGVVDTGGQSLRKLLLEAAVEQGLGRVDDALETARRARELHPERVEPLVHEALLRQHHFDPPRDPATAWREVLERARRSKGLGALVEELRARVVLERQGIFVP
jgi:tetratricopeptide (TPR) repeat protein